jgi:hypothetical protein
MGIGMANGKWQMANGKWQMAKPFTIPFTIYPLPFAIRKESFSLDLHEHLGIDQAADFHH